MIIIDVRLADFCEEKTTVSVKAAANGLEETFHVQTLDGIFRQDLGCWVLTNSSDGDIDADDYPDFDLSSIIHEAEKYIQERVTEELTDYKINNEWVYLLIDNVTNVVEVVTRNDNFINKDTSSYQSEFSEIIATFESRQEALEYVRGENEPKSACCSVHAGSTQECERGEG